MNDVTLGVYQDMLLSESYFNMHGDIGSAQTSKRMFGYERIKYFMEIQVIVVRRRCDTVTGPENAWQIWSRL